MRRELRGCSMGLACDPSTSQRGGRGAGTVTSCAG